MYSIDECNNILREGFPIDRKILKNMPFGDSILEAFLKKNPKHPKGSKDPDDKYLHRRHLKKIVESVNLLLKRQVRNIIRDREKPEAEPVVGRWINAWGKIHKDSAISSEEEQMWRLETFLHDVGKSLTPSKHPTRGQYLVTRLKIEERDRFIEVLGEHKDKNKGRERFNQIEKVIGFHDRFGVLSTGEASFGILADAVERGSREGEIEKAMKLISHIMVLNLIDIDASVPWGLISDKVEVILGDWEKSCWEENSPLRKSNGDRAEFQRMLLELASRDEWIINRIVRLLIESYRRTRDKAKKEPSFNSIKWPPVEEISFYPLVQNALRPNEIHWDQFRMDFAHVVKMDYLLYFVDSVLKRNWEKRHSPDELAGIFVKIIAKLINHFKNLIRQTNKRVRTGIDLSVLRSTPEVQEKIAFLLSGSALEADFGLEWLAHEATAWPFV